MSLLPKISINRSLVEDIDAKSIFKEDEIILILIISYISIYLWYKPPFYNR